MSNEPSQAPEQLNPELDFASAIGDLMEKGAEIPLNEDETEQLEEDDLSEVGENADEDGEESADEQKGLPDWESQEFEVNGEKVSGAELKAGYMKDADYRQKTAQAAQLRRDAEQKLEYVNRELSEKANRLDVLANVLYKEIAGDQAQLAELVESDPAEYLRRSHYLAQRNQLLQQALAEREAVSKVQAQTEQKQLAEYIQNEQALLVEALPEWRDKKVAEAEGREIAEYLLSKGYESKELSELYDHRALVLARKAMLYDKRASLKPAPVQKGASIAPGAPQAKQTNTKAREQLVNRAAKSRSTDDFAAAIRQYL